MTTAPHLFQRQEAEEGGRRATPEGPIVLTAEEQMLLPAERMTIAREKQAQQAALKAAGGQR